MIGHDFIVKLLNLRINKLGMDSSEKHKKEIKKFLDCYGELFDGSLY